ncbi:hypothetical protein EVAR_78984_1 [Eumeta japonica]|uniref:Uncharacterized protein n=1 Tax=Eumeta variegata TaxID=151549 RepID=A0A4C1UST5_EUMVA|nr:hypothetical protein EVAR_78984_1 [Eumeta japonica]
MCVCASECVHVRACTSVCVREANKQASHQRVNSRRRPWTVATPEKSRSHQCICGLLGRNRISDERGLVRWKGVKGKMATGIFTHWTKYDSGSCYFTSVFCENVDTLMNFQHKLQTDFESRARIERPGCWGVMSQRPDNTAPSRANEN